MRADAAPFDPSGRWVLHPSVAVRPESFGALLYHYGTRRLSFLKDPRLVDVVTGLESHPDLRAACVAAGVGADEQGRFEAALDQLARTDMLVRADA